jgi:hypothetical protein
MIYFYPSRSNEYVPKSNRKFFICFSTLSEIRITLQIILHSIQNIIKGSYVLSMVLSELIRKFSQYLAQFKI